MNKARTMPIDLSSQLNVRGFLTRPELLNEGYNDDDIRTPDSAPLAS